MKKQTNDEILKSTLGQIEKELTSHFIQMTSLYLFDPIKDELYERRLIRNKLYDSMISYFNKEFSSIDEVDNKEIFDLAEKSGKFKAIEDRIWDLILDKYHHSDNHLNNREKIYQSFISNNCEKQLIEIVDLLQKVKMNIFGLNNAVLSKDINKYETASSDIRSIKQPSEYVLKSLELIEQVHLLASAEALDQALDNSSINMKWESEDKPDLKMLSKEELSKKLLITFSDSLEKLENIVNSKKLTSQKEALLYLKVIKDNLSVLIDSGVMIELMTNFIYQYNNSELSITGDEFIIINNMIKKVDEKINNVSNKLISELTQLNKSLTGGKIIFKPTEKVILDKKKITERLDKLFPDGYPVYFYLTYLKTSLSTHREMHDAIIQFSSNSMLVSPNQKLISDHKDYLELVCNILSSIRKNIMEFDSANYVLVDEWKDQVELSKQLLDENENQYQMMIKQFQDTFKDRPLCDFEEAASSINKKFQDLIINLTPNSEYVNGIDFSLSNLNISSDELISNLSDAFNEIKENFTSEELYYISKLMPDLNINTSKNVSNTDTKPHLLTAKQKRLKRMKN